MEGRHFAIGDDKPVKEGNASSVALLIKSELERKGAVLLTRQKKSTSYKISPRDFKVLPRLGLEKEVV